MPCNSNQPRQGWAVQIRRDNGTTFLAFGSTGILPAVFTNSQRKYAVKFKKDLIRECNFTKLSARVVRVQFCDVMVIDGGVK